MENAQAAGIASNAPPMFPLDFGARQFEPFLQDLAMVLCVAAVITIVFNLLKQPPVLGYLLAGLILGPHVPIPIFAHEETVKTLAELGVIFVMFSIGLEFNLRKLVSVLPTAGLTTVIQIGVMVWLGFTAGSLLGWTTMESVFAGAIVAVSSTMICAKALLDQHKEAGITKLVFGVLILEDLAAVTFMAVLTPMAKGAHLSLTEFLMTMGSLLGFLGVLLGIGFLVVPRVVRSVVALRSPEMLLVTVVGICFAMSLLAHKGGYSVALGAFLAGMLTAESGAHVTIERLIQPLKDMFAAIFFVAVGMLVDPQTLMKHWEAVVIFTLVVVFGKIFSVSIGAFLSGQSLRTSTQAGMSMSQIGEFSFIIAQVGVATGAIRGHLYDISVAVAVTTAFATPWLMKASDPISDFVDAHLPRPLQTFTALYGSWVERLRSGGQTETLWRKVRRVLAFLALDTLLLMTVIITTAATVSRWLPELSGTLSIPPLVLKVILIGGGGLFAIPFIGGILRGVRNLGVLIANAAIAPVEEGKLDLGLAPRKVLTLAIQFGALFVVGFPLLAFTQPFLPFGFSPLLLGLLAAVLGAFFWKRAVNLHGHVQAGAELLAKVISRNTDKPAWKIQQDAVVMGPNLALQQVARMVPGIGEPVSVPIAETFSCVGKTLGELNLRSQTGASVIAVTRGDEHHLMPSGREKLMAGDTLVLVGTHEAIEQARGLLQEKL